jgi:hypothetical protein
MKIIVVIFGFFVSIAMIANRLFLSAMFLRPRQTQDNKPAKQIFTLHFQIWQTLSGSIRFGAAAFILYFTMMWGLSLNKFFSILIALIVVFPWAIVIAIIWSEQVRTYIRGQLPYIRKPLIVRDFSKQLSWIIWTGAFVLLLVVAIVILTSVFH